jgi:hypothetical protein
MTEWQEQPGSLLCMPVGDRDGWRHPDGHVAPCVKCGVMLDVAPSSWPRVRSGQLKPRCAVHPPEEDEAIMGLLNEQAFELHEWGMNADAQHFTYHAFCAWIEREWRRRGYTGPSLVNAKNPYDVI